MFRAKLLRTGAVSFILLFAAISAFAQDGGVTALWPPTFENFNPNDSFYICQGSTIYDTIIVTNYEATQTITITKTSGPGDFSSTPSVSPAYGCYSYTPTSEGSFQVVYEAINSGGRKATATKTYYIFFNHPPQILTGDTSFYDCFPLQNYTYQINATDFENDPLTYSLLSGDGTIDPVTGLLSFSIAVSGTYCFEVRVADSCGSDTAQICINATLNRLPSLNGFAQKVNLCAPENICFTIGGSDPDAGDSLVISQKQGIGTFEMVGADSGKTCFTPADVDSADYIFIYSATDNCLRGEIGGIPPEAPEVLDTVIYTVIISPAPALACPEDTNLTICHPDTLCFPVGNISHNSTVIVTPPSAWFDYETNSICFYTNCSVIKNLKMVASSPCGTDSCQFTARVTMNATPLVIFAPDTTVRFCSPQYVCIPVGVEDSDNDILDISVSGGASYNPITGTVCFRPDSTGNYYIRVTATDGCGAKGTDSILVHANINVPPIIISDGNYSMSLCSLEQVCVPVNVSDANLNLRNVNVSSGGIYNDQAKTVCFTPIQFGLNPIVVTAYDSCGAMNSDSIFVTILQNNPPMVQSAPDSTVDQCILSTICFPVTVSDPDNDLMSVTVNNEGTYSAGSVCFMPDHAGPYQMIITATDSCGNVAADTTNINVSLNVPPVIQSADDFSVEQCALANICFSVQKISGNISEIVSDKGYFDMETGEVCFLPTAFGIDTIIVTATDFCGATDIDTTIITITQGAVADIICPTPENLSLCHPDSIHIPIAITPSSADVVSSHGQFSNGTLSFYADTSGIYEIQIIASAPCGSDTCTVTVNVTIGEAPIITCPTQTINSYLCQSGQVCIDFPITGYQNVEVTGGTWADGRLCFMADTSGSYTLTAMASNDCGADTCHLTVTVEIGRLPNISCPMSPIDTFLCAPGQICIDVPITDYDTVQVIGCYWSNGKLCFPAESTGPHNFRIIATNGCGADTCDLTVNVTIGSKPIISCPTAPIDTFICAPTEICVDVPITNYQNVSVEGATWVNGKLCFMANATGNNNFTLVASNSCGADTCHIAVNVTLGKIPTITCPTGPIDTFLCAPGQLCIDLPVIDYDSVYVIGCYWSHDRLCFSADSTGPHNFKVIAVSKCGADTCDVTVNVTIGNKPVISCPPTSIDTFICAPTEICISVPIANYENVSVDGGTWADGQLCFTADAPGNHDFRIIATSPCGTDSCHVFVNVTMGSLPVISCPTGPLHLTGCRGTDSICVELPITGADSVISIGATWNNGVLCFWPGDLKVGDSMMATIIASNKCGDDTCEVTAYIHLTDPPVISCPPGGDYSACAGDTICVPMYVTPGSEVVVINGIFNPPGKAWDTGKLCIVVTETGMVNTTVIATNNCGADTSHVAFNITIGTKPQLTCPADTTVTLCSPQTICRPIQISQAGATITVSPIGTYENGDVCFSPDTAGIYTLKVKAESTCGSDSCSFNVTVKFNNPPILAAKDTSLFVCALQTPISLDVIATDEENDPIIYRLISPSGQIDSLSGTLNFTPDSIGSHCFTVTASDWCGVDTATICANITANRLPIVVSGNDTTISECTNKPICITVIVSDLDNNIDSVYSSIGTYSDGKVCFTPEGAGTYYIVTTAVDHCGARAADTTNVTAQVAQPVSLVCPKDTSVFLCAAGNVCIPFGGIPHGATVVINPPSAWLSADSSNICFSTNCSVVKNLKVVVSNSCGKDSCSFKATVTMNSKPMANLAPDTTVSLCQLGTICIPAGVSDVDSNITNIVVSPSGSYNPITGRVCFTPTGTGQYMIILRATDACGAVGADSVRVTVNLNRPPVVNSDTDFSISQCGPAPICFGVNISDPDNETPSVIVSPPGVYDPIAKKICFTPTVSGNYKITVTAIDHCGLSAKDSTIVHLTAGPVAQVGCAPDTSVLLCAPDTVSRNVTITPDSAQIIISPAGVYRNGKVYFRVDTSGVYTVTVIASAECGSDTCSFRVNAKINSAPVVNAGIDTTYHMCSLTQICRKVSITDPDDNIKTISVEPIGSYVPGAGEICYTPAGVGTQCLKVIAEDYCGKADTDEVCITVAIGATVDIQCPTDPFTRHICNPAQVCVPLVVTPPDAQVTVSNGIFANNQVCFNADTAGTYKIRAIATASCGADTCNLTVNVIVDPKADITCPTSPTTVSLCGPDSVRILLPITPSNATVTVSPNGNYNAATHMLSFWANTSGTYNRTVIASATCGADTCVVTANVTIGQAAQVTCPGNIDTTVCVSSTSQICFPVTVTPSSANVSVKPSGSYSSGRVCIPITGAGTYPVSVIASTTCGTDTCSLNLKVNDNTAPVLTVPSNQIIAMCDDSIHEICIDGIFATDVNKDNLVITKTCGLGSYIAVDSDSGEVCFTPTNIDSTYNFCIQVSDGCRTSSKSFTVQVYPSPECLVCADISIETDSCVVVGSTVPVRIVASARDSVAGFDLLISYDVSVTSFLSAKKGDAIGGENDGWEYFTSRVGTVGGCGSCPSGLVRLIGLADLNNGPAHPTADWYLPQGTLAVINLRVSSDQNLGGQFIPISFFWYDCGDNALSDKSGINLYVDSKIYNSSGSVIWDESNDVLFPESERPFGMGAPDSCMTGGKVSPKRCVNFHSGGICVIHPDSIDLRGDLNLNNVPNEIGDAVVYTNYFLYGLAAFVISVDGQTAASDVNGDGYVLTVADLVYLIRIITGDAEPLSKLSPEMANVDLTSMSDGNQMAIDINHSSAIGGGFMSFKYKGVRPVNVEAGESTSAMTVSSIITDSEVRILFYSFDRGAMIDPGKSELVRISYEGDGSLELSEASFASYNGEALTTRLSSGEIPSQFVLAQNYPNPFNPRTTIALSMPAASDWRLTIYNVTGQVVKRLSGFSGAGTTSIEWDGYNDMGQPATSGIYFYKVEAGTFTATRKMILLK